MADGVPVKGGEKEEGSFNQGTPQHTTESRSRHCQAGPISTVAWYSSTWAQRERGQLEARRVAYRLWLRLQLLRPYDIRT